MLRKYEVPDAISVSACVHACMPACLCAYVHLCLCACEPGCLAAYLLTMQLSIHVSILLQLHCSASWLVCHSRY